MLTSVKLVPAHYAAIGLPNPAITTGNERIELESVRRLSGVSPVFLAFGNGLPHLRDTSFPASLLALLIGTQPALYFKRVRKCGNLS